MRIVRVFAVAQWNGTQEGEFVLVPDTMDLEKEQKAWFAAGAGSVKNFVDHLVGRGARRLDDTTDPKMEQFVIAYQ